MPWRLQNLVSAVGINKQTNISTVSASFARFAKLDATIFTNDYNTETDEDEIGKGTEFPTNVFPTNWDFGGGMQKYGSAEWMTYGWAYALGTVGYAGGTYTISPLDNTQTLELPYFSVVQQGSEGGASALDELYLGCAMEEVTTTFKYGPGRESIRTNVAFNGAGLMTSPSGVTVPGTQVEHYMLAQAMTTLTINGVDYIAGKTMLSGTLGWKNNLLLPQGYYPGSGATANGFASTAVAAVRGRIEIGKRMPTFTFICRMLHTSAEYLALLQQTTGSATLTFFYDATHQMTFTFNNVKFSKVIRGNDAGLVTVEVTVRPVYVDTLAHFVTVSAQCGLANIAQ